MTPTPTPLSELFATLKGYVNQLSAGERSPSEVGSALNDWARDSAESIKAKIHEEVDASVSKMGFIKRDEFEALQQRLEKLEKKNSQPLSKKEKKKEVKNPAKNSVKNSVKKSARAVLKESVKSKKAKVGK